jgi:hypothetical protein
LRYSIFRTLTTILGNKTSPIFASSISNYLHLQKISTFVRKAKLKDQLEEKKSRRSLFPENAFVAGNLKDHLLFSKDCAYAADRSRRMQSQRSKEDSSSVSSRALAAFSVNLPVPAAQRSFMAKSKTRPCSSMRMISQSWPPI